MISSKLKNYYYFRLKQFFRIANNDLGSIVIYFVFGFIIYFYDIKYSWLYLIYYIFPPLYFLNKRKDTSFIKQIFVKKQYFILLSEYLMVYLIIFVLIYNKTYVFVSAVGFLFCFIYPLINIKKTEWTKKINFSFLPSETFEWKSYFRKRPLFFILFFFLLTISSYHPFTLWVMIFLFCDVINSIYSIVEPKEIYYSYFSNKKLSDKLEKSLILINLIILIPFMLSVIFNPNLWYLIIASLFVLNMFSATIILSKYSNYNINYDKVNTQNMGQIIEIFVSIILIFPWVYNFYQLKKKAQNKISLYV